MFLTESVSSNLINDALAMLAEVGFSKNPYVQTQPQSLWFDVRVAADDENGGEFRFCPDYKELHCYCKMCSPHHWIEDWEYGDCKGKDPTCWNGNVWVWCQTHWISGHPYLVPIARIECNLQNARNEIVRLANERLLILSYRARRQKMPIFGDWVMDIA